MATYGEMKTVTRRPVERHAGDVVSSDEHRGAEALDLQRPPELPADAEQHGYGSTARKTTYALTGTAVASASPTAAWRGPPRRHSHAPSSGSSTTG